MLRSYMVALGGKENLGGVTVGKEGFAYIEKIS
jgi:hypothetical protein